MWWTLCAVALASDWSAGVGASASTGNASALTSSGFVQGGVEPGRHTVRGRVGVQLGAAVLDADASGTSADDPQQYAITEQNVLVDSSYGYALGSQEEGGAPPPELVVAAAVEHLPTSGMGGSAQHTGWASILRYPAVRR